MACLSYSPTNIEYKKKTYTRENLLVERAQKMLNLLSRVAPIKTKHYIIDTVVKSNFDNVDIKKKTECKVNVPTHDKFGHPVPEISLSSARNHQVSHNSTPTSHRGTLFVDSKLMDSLISTNENIK